MNKILYSGKRGVRRLLFTASIASLGIHMVVCHLLSQSLTTRGCFKKNEGLGISTRKTFVWGIPENKP